MKTTIAFIFILLIFMSSQAQNSYSVTTDPNHPEQKMLLGVISKNQLSSDTAFKWYASNYKNYLPDTATINTFKRNPALQFIIFGGTWCEDTQTIVPKFFKLLELAGIAESNLSFFAVDRNKKTYGHLAEAFGITNVPTIIALKNGREINRVVEYGKTGNWDKELAAGLQ